MPIDASQVARVLGITPTFANLAAAVARLLPQRVAIVAQGASAATYATTKLIITSRKEAGDTYGYGSPIERIAAQLFPSNGDGIGSIPVTVYPLEDDAAGVPAAGSLDASGTQSTAQAYTIRIGGVEATALVPATSDEDTAMGLFKIAIDAVPEMPVITGVVAVNSLPITAKWDGASGNNIEMSITGTTSGITYSVTQLTSGATNPDVDDALNLITEVWETMIINGMEDSDTASFTKYATWGEGRYGATTHKPAIVFTGSAETTLATLEAISDARTTDKINSYIHTPGSDELPFAICARAVARIARLANNTPPHDYAGQTLTQLEFGTDAEQMTGAQRQTAVLAGVSTTELVDGVAELSDTVTFYHPAGEDPPAYRYVADIVKVQNIVYNTALIFAAPEWNGAPLVSDATPTIEPTAKKPKDAVAEIARMADQLALRAIITDPGTVTKPSIVAVINGSNPKRLDVSFSVKLSGNTNIIDTVFKFGFNFG